VLLCLGVATALGALYVIYAPREYQSQTQLFISTSAAATDPTAVFQGGEFSQARVQSYAEIVGGPKVAQEVADLLGDTVSAKTIENEVGASAPLNTVLLNVTVTDHSPTRARAIADGIGEVFPAIVTRLEDTDANGHSPVKVTVVKPATYSDSAVSPRIPLDLGLALLAGLVVGVGGAILRDTLDNTVKTPEDIQAAGGGTMLGVIAFDPDARDHPLIATADLHGTRAEAFRQLRTNLQFVDVDQPLRSIVCTSSVPGEGKTTTICNLAITLAQAGLHVLLVEADLRRPRVGTYLGLDGSVGLTSLLIGAVEFDQVVQRWGQLQILDVLPSGPTPPNPSELLGSRGMADLLRSLENRYDVVLLDAPPLLPVTDAAVLAVEASGALMVVHHGRTRREQLENAAQALTGVGARMLGCVMNFAPRKGPEAYYYGYAYSYRNIESGATGPAVPSTRSVSTKGTSSGTTPVVLNGTENRTSGNSSQPATWPSGPAMPEDLEPARRAAPEGVEFHNPHPTSPSPTTPEGPTDTEAARGNSGL
jgi:non-specific protein-tyrosine kinase